MRGADRRKTSKKVATSSNGAAAAHTVERRETLLVLTRMSIRPSRGGRCPRLRKPSEGGACSDPHTDRCISAPARGRFRIARPLLTLSCRRCDPTVSSSPEGGKRVGADIEAPVTWAAHPAGNRTRSRPVSVPTSRTPASSGIFGDSCHRTVDFLRCRHPRLKPFHVIGDRTPPFHQIARHSPPVEADLPLIQLRNHDFDHFVTKLRFLYTPDTARNGSPIGDPPWRHHA